MSCSPDRQANEETFGPARLVSFDPRAPVIVGVGQVVVRDPRDLDSCEPVALMAEALRIAAEDSGIGERLLRRADSVRCVPVIAWHYMDAAALVAEDLGATPLETVQSAAIGGDGPQRLLNDSAALPVIMYALFESAVRASSQNDRKAHLAKIARLWSRFSYVAVENPFAWIGRRCSAEEIATPGSGNRPVAAPYTKLVTANMQVNMGSGLIVCSEQAAHDAGVPKDRWVFIHASAQAYDEWHVTERPSLTASPAIRAVGRASLGYAGLGIDDVAYVDLYSCFPSAVQIAANELGLELDDSTRPLTVTGGLTFAGGPGNNYSAHAIATIVRRLREDPDAYGLATAVGWYLTKHAVGIYSARPPRRPFASLTPQTERHAPRRSLTRYAGLAMVEAYTITYERDGTPRRQSSAS